MIDACQGRTHTRDGEGHALIGLTTHGHRRQALGRGDGSAARPFNQCRASSADSQLMIVPSLAVLPDTVSV